MSNKLTEMAMDILAIEADLPYRNEAPYISVDVDFYPEHLIDRLNTNDKE